jgi:hypothetical protein
MIPYFSDSSPAISDTEISPILKETIPVLLLLNPKGLNPGTSSLAFA